MGKYTEEQIIAAVAAGRSFNESHTLLTGSCSGSSYMWFKRRVFKLDLDTSHYDPHWANRDNRLRTNLISSSDILMFNPDSTKREPTHRLRRALREFGVEDKCHNCGIITWQDKQIVLEVEHIDGNWRNNLLENLTLLCPNCHSQTSTYGHKSKKIPKAKIVKLKIPRSLSCECGQVKSHRASTCMECHHLKKRKIVWPSRQELIDRLANSNYSKLARELGVSDNAIRKHLQSSE